MNSTMLQASKEISAGGNGLRSARRSARTRTSAVMRTVTPAVASATIVDGLEQALQRKGYRAVLLDQFGCIHDGRIPYPSAIDAVKRLHEAGVAIYIVSNSSRRSGGMIGKLERMGFMAKWFAGGVTSGELAHQYLEKRPSDWWKTLGRRVLHLTWSERGAVSLDGLNLEVVDWPEEADFILAHGTEAVGSAWGRKERGMSLAQLNQLLVRCAAQQQVSGHPLPMVVANPDLVTVDGDQLVIMPGTLAKTYEGLGGNVQYMGKPDAVIYHAALKALGLQDHPEQVLAIGDSLHHDIGGASAMGIDSLLVANGIHAQELLKEQEVDSSALQRLSEECKQQPTYVVPHLRW